MKLVPAAAVLVLASFGSAAAQVRPIVPISQPPPYGANQTANLLFQTQLAISRAASANPQAAQSAALSYQQAVQRYNAGDVTAARTAALQALMSANAQVPHPIPTLRALPPTSGGALGPLVNVNGGNVAAIDAQAFIGQARGAVAACVTANDPHTAQAETQLAAALRAEGANDYNAVRAAAKKAVDLCSAARR